VIFLACVLPSCEGAAIAEDYFFTMDTAAETMILSKEPETGKAAAKKIREICEEVEGRISNTIETSEIYKLNEFFSGGQYGLSPFYLSEKTADLLKTAKYIKEQTGGAYEPNLGELIDLWGINNPEQTHKLPEKDDFYPALEKVQNLYFDLDENDEGIYYASNLAVPPKLDLGGIGKGHALDEIGAYLVETGIPHALVSFGSSVLVVGKNKIGSLWTVGLKDPLDPEKLCGYISATDKVISVSGGYERYITIDGKDYCHIIDPATGYPVENDLLCVAVVMSAPSALQEREQREKLTKNGAICDALSTALYVMGKERALKFYDTTDLDFEMILFVKTEDEKGYDIIPTNVMFSWID